MKFIREKKVSFGTGFLDVDLFEADDEYTPPLKRAGRYRISPPHIIAANERHSKNHLRQIIMHNFGRGDYYITPTYADGPPDVSAAQRELTNYIGRLKRLYKKHGVEFRAVYVTEGGRHKTDGTRTRIHHHIVVPGGVPRDEIEQAWTKRRKGDAVKRGFCNTAVITPEDGERGCERIAEYMAKSRTKSPGKGVRRWNATRNIKRPVETVIDNKFSRRQTEGFISDGREYAQTLADSRMIKEAVRSEQWEKLRRTLEKRYKRELIDVISSINPFTGRVYVSARFRPRI